MRPCNQDINLQQCYKGSNPGPVCRQFGRRFNIPNMVTMKTVIQIIGSYPRLGLKHPTNDKEQLVLCSNLYYRMSIIGFI